MISNMAIDVPDSKRIWIVRYCKPRTASGGKKAISLIAHPTV